MNLRRSSTATVIAAALAAVTIAGCATTLAGNPTAASSVVPTTAEQQTPTEETESSAPVEPETSAVQPPLDPTSSEATESSQAAPGGELDSDSVNWISTFCTGFGDVMAYAGPDTTGMSDEATIQTVVDSYGAMASAADSLAADLQSVPQPTFAGAPAMTSAIDTWLRTITAVYGAGAQQIASQTFTSADQLTDAINQIEAGVAQSSQELSGAMGQIDPAVRDTMHQIPACAPLMG